MLFFFVLSFYRFTCSTKLVEQPRFLTGCSNIVGINFEMGWPCGEISDKVMVVSFHFYGKYFTFYLTWPPCFPSNGLG